MPIYEYLCRQCQSVFPRLQRIGATAEGVRCPECGSAEVERRPSAFASTASGSASFGTSSGGCGSGGFT